MSKLRGTTSRGGCAGTLFGTNALSKGSRRLSKENKVTYRQQYTRCGKQRCRKCQEGNGHGPYWYAYWSENGRTVSKYIGVGLPDTIKEGNQAQILEVAASLTRENSGARPDSNQGKAT